MPNNLRQCGKCGKIAEHSPKGKICKSCKKEYAKEYYKNNADQIRERIKKWKEENMEVVAQRKKDYYYENREQILKAQKKKRETKEYQKMIKEYRRLYYLKNKNRISQKTKIDRVKNPEKYRRHYMNYKEKNPFKKMERMKRDPLFKMAETIRNRMRAAIKLMCAGGKPASAVDSLGCSMKEFKVHIESLFSEGMSWDNHGNGGWHLDHIKPLSSFKLDDPKEYAEACHYTNYQPLWAVDNLRKGNKQLEECSNAK